ncbi:NAD(P)/FAD-dependent oxidoreductase [Phytoactinopolyspora mesophila]|uniref:NAD(P)/FAD-dependent oxidoreductase n=1 Tax=Phytoactinopolyspora mesophila TaxID=2650750 RepID=A0A7K3LYS3_9ACTN|nr:NAD(P)/FAD-dependent oxidoreductase [Phytoactinopolyspora mesophila]NDL56183.1 NAD(P)/FAD-dependent oxidoreductase [Phytoactinopolyspora mesophila]
MSASTYDTIVVGARVAGATTALLLARLGLRVLVLDRGRYGGDTVSTHALMRGGVWQLQRLGVLDDVAAAGTPPVRRVHFHYPDDTTRVTLKPTPGVDALYAPRRTLLDRIIVDRATAAGADVRFGMTVTALSRDHTGRIIGVVASDRLGRRLRASGPLTIGADGIGSIVARAVGAPLTWAASGAGSAFLYGYWDHLPAEGYEWYYSPGVSAGLIPTNDGQTTVFVGTTPEKMKLARAGGTWPGFRTLAEAVSPDLRARLADGQPPRRLRGFTGVTGYLRQSWGPGWALAGDAGSFEDPLSTHGITDALRDASLLSEAILRIHAGGATEAEALSAYQRTRDALALPLLTTVDSISSYQWTVAELQRSLLDASSAMSEQFESTQDHAEHSSLARVLPASASDSAHRVAP